MTDDINELSDEALDSVVGGAYDMGVVKKLGLQITTRGNESGLTIRTITSNTYSKKTLPAAGLERMITRGVTSCEIQRADGSFYKADLNDMKAICGMK